MVVMSGDWLTFGSRAPFCTELLLGARCAGLLQLISSFCGDSTVADLLTYTVLYPSI